MTDNKRRQKVASNRAEYEERTPDRLNELEALDTVIGCVGIAMFSADYISTVPFCARRKRRTRRRSCRWATRF